MPAGAALSRGETALFYKLWLPFLSFMTQRYPTELEAKTPEEIKRTPIRELMAVREKLYGQPEVIDFFAAANPYGFSEDELAIVRG